MDIKIQEKSTKENMKILGTYISLDVFKKLQEEADLGFTSVSSIVRKALYNYINTKEEKDKIAKL